MAVHRSLTHDGGRLRSRLLVLMMLPLIGVAAGSALQVVQQVGSARTSADAEIHVRGAGAVDAVRAALGQEIGPAYVAAVARNPSLVNVAQDVTAAAARAAIAIIAKVPVLRAATDAAIRGMLAYRTVAAAGRRFVPELAAARREIDAASVVTDTVSSRARLLADLTDTENTEIAEATHDGLDEDAMQAVRDVDLTARAAQAASGEFELFAASKFAAVGDPTLSRTTWVQAWGIYSAAVDTLLARASAPMADQWRAADHTRLIAQFNSFLRSDVVSPVKITVLQGVEVVTQDGPRDTAYSGVLATALDRAADAARTQHDRATIVLQLLILGALAMLVISATVAVLVRRSVSIPLELLAEQATRISEGELTDVDVRGPREVRTVARALASSVASLRNIEAQVAAVAAGELDSPVVRTPLPGPLGRAVNASVAQVVHAIKDRERAQTDLAHRAAHDALTELPNRAQAIALIDRALHRAQRSATKTALMFIDLDYFKAVNDNYGHAAGDEVLQLVARRMQTVVRDGDTVARLGGDEFLVLLEDTHDEADVVKLAERLIVSLSTEMLIEQRSIRVGASIGVAICRDGYVDADRLLHEADAAAYRAKKAGRGRVDIFDDDLRTQLAHRSELEHAIAAGMSNDEFVLHYQPIVSLSSGATVGVEALIRWHRPGHGMIRPDDFIPVAEQSSLINDMGRWVLHQATQQLADWQRRGLQPSTFQMSVNISGHHLASSELVTDVTDALTQSGVDPRLLTVELTETVLVDDPLATRNMQTLRALGVQISIDDFGTGFTSIGQLPRLPVDSLKIDRSFVVSPDPAHQELVRLIIAAAHAFGLTVVAEGIEHEHQADRLRNAHADTGQGYFFARPQPAEALFDSLFAPAALQPVSNGRHCEPVAATAR